MLIVPSSFLSLGYSYSWFSTGNPNSVSGRSLLSIIFWAWCWSWSTIVRLIDALIMIGVRRWTQAPGIAFSLRRKIWMRIVHSSSHWGRSWFWFCSRFSWSRVYGIDLILNLIKNTIVKFNRASIGMVRWIPMPKLRSIRRLLSSNSSFYLRLVFLWQRLFSAMSSWTSLNIASSSKCSYVIIVLCPWRIMETRTCSILILPKRSCSVQRPISRSSSFGFLHDSYLRLLSLWRRSL